MSFNHRLFVAVVTLKKNGFKMSVSSFGSKSSSFSMKSQAVIDELQKQRQKDAMEKEEYVSEKDNFYVIETCVLISRFFTRENPGFFEL